ncbi:fructose-bisphosphate aldolase class I [Constrictibacter sp. MBR-5]|jgi:fructose-bisphosphate aldolase class I|uniref:class I fructose-bisphosphate aldolase n=1 Tax=Constrictibacter sp. MBR-5 TaxID=3156467 RepID=UPI0033938923
MNLAELERIARSLVAPGKGILAADESSGTIKRRFDGIGVASNEQNRRDYRELLLAAPGAEAHISGVILFDETLRQSASDGRPFVDVLNASGIIPGIKVDKGAKPLPFAPEETITEGLDDLRERCAEYRTIGARFTKWRAVIKIDDRLPTTDCINTNAHALARYAAIAQEQGLVPIVEPEVLMDGGHDIERCRIVTEAVLVRVFYELHRQRVAPEGMLLKPNMVIDGNDCLNRSSAEDVAAATVRTLRRCVPSAVPGIVFLSGGQSEEEATANLAAMATMGPHPWRLSFSYGRALQQSALATWAGRRENVAAARRTYLHRARMNGLASEGRWRPQVEKEDVA